VRGRVARVKIQLVSHASVIVETEDCVIWTDPWLFGKAFNDSWSLLGPAAWDEAWLAGIDFLWISHEHPDHFHIPTLRSLPDAFKQRVTVLFQQNNSDKMFEAFSRLGFTRHRALPHRSACQLTESTSVYCYQVLPMDSALAVTSGGACVLDLNDTEVNARDCRTIHQDLGRVDVVLNQFSVAGYAGLADRARHLGELAASVLENVAENHKALHAGCTIPIASFIYFSAEDNRYVNAFGNTPERVVTHLAARGLETAVLFPGDVFDSDTTHDSTHALARWADVYAGLDALPYEATKRVALTEIEAAFHDCARDLHDKYPGWLLRRLEPITLRIPDLARTIRFSLANATFEAGEASEQTTDDPDLEVNSQPLHLVFASTFGMQTLGVSARLVVHRSTRSWRLHRILFSMYNAEIYLRARYLLTGKNFRFARTHLSGGLSQILHRLSLMR
jgi:UDP-MurNAc hydroxylase